MHMWKINVRAKEVKINMNWTKFKNMRNSAPRETVSESVGKDERCDNGVANSRDFTLIVPSLYEAILWVQEAAGNCYGKSGKSWSCDEALLAVTSLLPAAVTVVSTISTKCRLDMQEKASYRRFLSFSEQTSGGFSVSTSRGIADVSFTMHVECSSRGEKNLPGLVECTLHQN